MAGGEVGEGRGYVDCCFTASRIGEGCRKEQIGGRYG
jgi:hypothetical protein